MKEIAIKDIKRQIDFYKSRLGKYPSLKYDEVEIAKIEGTIFGLEEAIISVKRA